MRWADFCETLEKSNDRFERRYSNTFVHCASRADWEAKFPEGKRHPAAEYGAAGSYNKRTGFEMEQNQRPIEECKPYYIQDVPDHEGPSGRWITSKSGVREERKRTGTVEWDRISDRPRGVLDPRVAKVRKTQVCEKTQAWMADKYSQIANGTLIKPSTPKLDYVAKEKKNKAIRDVIAKHGLTD